MLVGDAFHLAFLGVAWPIGLVSNTLVQLLCLALVSRQNEELCRTPVRQGGAALLLPWLLHSSCCRRSALCWVPHRHQLTTCLFLSSPLLSSPL